MHEELGSSDRSGKPEKLSEDIRVKHAHDGTGQLVEPSSSSTHIVKEQFVPEENRDIASFNADNDMERKKGTRISHCESTPKEMRILEHSRSFRP